MVKMTVKIKRSSSKKPQIQQVEIEPLKDYLFIVPISVDDATFAELCQAYEGRPNVVVIRSTKPTIIQLK
jgi:hypothetical protein